MSAFILRSKPSGYDRETQFKNGKISIGWARVAVLRALLEINYLKC